MALQTFPSLSNKSKLMKSVSFCFNSRNMENPWYGLWARELEKMSEPFNNLVIIPQYALWFTMEDNEQGEESIEKVDEDAVSKIGDEGDDIDEGSTHELDDSDDEDAVNEIDDEGNILDEGSTHKSDDSSDELDLFKHLNKDSDDELDLLRDKDESTENQNSIPQDPDTSIAESLITVPDRSAPQLTPDFVALHILAKKLSFPTNACLSQTPVRALSRIHECCLLIVEIKSFPSRSVTRARFKVELGLRLETAWKDLGYQCYHLFKRYKHAYQTIAILASGDYWTHIIVSWSDVPRGAGDEMNTETWDALVIPDAVILGTPASDLRMQEISDYLRERKPDLPLD